MRKIFLFAICTGILVTLIFILLYTPKEEMIVRKPAVAGKFYPDSPDKLETVVSNFLSQAPDFGIQEIRGLVVPHAGYVYSGRVAAFAYRQLKNKYDTIILIGPSHHARFYGASVPNYTHYKTPFGLVRVSPKVKLLLQEGFISDNRIHEPEHSLEVQLPFLQETLNNFEIIPIVTGTVNPEGLADVLIKYIDDRTLIIASSDLSHYHTYSEALRLDSYCLNGIPNLNFTAMERCEACGKIPVLTLMHIAKKLGWKGKVLEYKNSGDVTGNKSRVVGYTSVVFYSEPEKNLTEEEKKFLLALARNTLEHYLKNRTLPYVNESMLTQNLRKVQGCFVTLHKHGNLRGCIGHILPEVPLYKCVIQNSINAALHDSRFQPVEYSELKDIDIEISVLSVPKPLEVKEEKEVLQRIPGFGVVLNYQGKRSTFLPQVWEIIPNPQEFLSRLCLKQFSPPECWKSARIDVYRAVVFDEKDL